MWFWKLATNVKISSGLVIILKTFWWSTLKNCWMCHTQKLQLSAQMNKSRTHKSRQCEFVKFRRLNMLVCKLIHWRAALDLCCLNRFLIVKLLVGSHFRGLFQALWNFAKPRWQLYKSLTHWTRASLIEPSDNPTCFTLIFKYWNTAFLFLKENKCILLKTWQKLGFSLIVFTK